MIWDHDIHYIHTLSNPFTHQCKCCAVCCVNTITFNIWTMTHTKSYFINLCDCTEDYSKTVKLIIWIYCFLSVELPEELHWLQHCTKCLWRIGLLSPLVFAYVSDVYKRLIHKQCMFRYSHSLFLAFTESFWLMNHHGRPWTEMSLLHALVAPTDL